MRLASLVIVASTHFSVPCHPQDGKPDGLGVLSLRDGASYDAQWAAGRRHGVCVYHCVEATGAARRRV